MLNRIGSRVTLVLLALAMAASPSSATSIVVPSPVEMIALADVIVEGRLALRDEKVELTVEKVYKGSVGDRTRLELISEQSILDFSLVRVAARRGAESVIVLGRMKGRTGGLTLPWLDSSIWPREAASVLSAPPTLESARALVLGSDRLAKSARKGPEPLVSDLVSGFEQPSRRSAVLGFLESRLDPFVAEPELRRALFLVIGGQLIEARPKDAASVESVARIVPMLPPAAALDYLLDAARCEDTRIASLAYASARSVLIGRKLIEPDQLPKIVDLAAMETIAARVLPGLRAEDARDALTLFDSPLLEVRSRAGNVVGALLGEPQPDSAPVNLEAARSFWAAKVQAAEIKIRQQP